MKRLPNRGVFYTERDFDPFKDGKPGEKVDFFGVEYTLVGPRVKHGNYFLNHRKGEAVVIRLPRTFLPEDYGGWPESLGFAEIALEKGKDQAFALMLKEHEREGLRQFVEMLYDASGSAKPSGYLALLRLRERLDETVDDFFDQLEQYATELVERRKRGQTGEFFAQEVKRKVAFHEAIIDRLSILRVVIHAFETKGTAPTVWDVIKRKRERSGDFERTAFDVKLDAIKKVVTDPELLQGLRYKSELYREAARKEGLKLEEPADSFRKDINNNFPDRFGRPVPEDPKEWRRFFEGGKRNGKPHSNPSAPESGTESP